MNCKPEICIKGAHETFWPSEKMEKDFVYLIYDIANLAVDILHSDDANEMTTFGCTKTQKPKHRIQMCFKTKSEWRHALDTPEGDAWKMIEITNQIKNLQMEHCITSAIKDLFDLDFEAHKTDYFTIGEPIAFDEISIELAESNEEKIYFVDKATITPKWHESRLATMRSPTKRYLIQ